MGAPPGERDGDKRRTSSLASQRRDDASQRVERVLFVYLVAMALCQQLHAHGGRLDRLEVPVVALTLGFCARRLVARAWRGAASLLADAALPATPAIRLLRACTFVCEYALVAALALYALYFGAYFVLPAPVSRLVALVLPSLGWLLATRALSRMVLQRGPPSATLAHSPARSPACADARAGAGSSACAAASGSRRKVGAAGAASSSTSALASDRQLSLASSLVALCLEPLLEALACALCACVLPALAFRDLDDLLDPAGALLLCAQVALSSFALLTGAAAVSHLAAAHSAAHEQGAWASLGCSALRPAGGWQAPPLLLAQPPAEAGRWPAQQPWAQHGGCGGGGGQGCEVGKLQLGGSTPGLPDGSGPGARAAAALAGGRGAGASAGTRDGNLASNGASSAACASAAGHGGPCCKPARSAAAVPGHAQRPAPADLAPESDRGGSVCASWCSGRAYGRGSIVAWAGQDWIALGSRTAGQPGSAGDVLAFALLCEPDCLPRALVAGQACICACLLCACAWALGPQHVRRHWLASVLEALSGAAVLLELIRLRRQALRTLQHADGGGAGAAAGKEGRQGDGAFPKKREGGVRPSQSSS